MNKGCCCKEEGNNLFLVSTGGKKETNTFPLQEVLKDRFDKYLVGTVWTKLI